MDEVRPGLWIGNVGAITQLDQRCDGQHYTRWTVITVLTDITLLRLVRSTIAEYHSKREHSTGTSSLLNHTEVVDHIEWILPDTLQADFVSPKLLNVLDAMNQVIHPTNFDEYNINNIKVTNACLVHCAAKSSLYEEEIRARYILPSRHGITSFNTTTNKNPFTI